VSSFGILHVRKIVPDAYHGTSKGRAEKILREGFQITAGDEQYLGDGVYFFEGSQADAIAWAERRFRGGKCAVIQATINLGRCLDLHNPENAELILDSRRAIEERQSRLPDNDAQKRLQITDGLIINFLAQRLPFDTVRASQITGFPKSGSPKKMFSGSHFYNPQRLIVCVRNLSSILSLKVI
jgi:hypothetical protein